MDTGPDHPAVAIHGRRQASLPVPERPRACSVLRHQGDDLLRRGHSGKLPADSGSEGLGSLVAAPARRLGHGRRRAGRRVPLYPGHWIRLRARQSTGPAIGVLATGGVPGPAVNPAAAAGRSLGQPVPERAEELRGSSGRQRRPGGRTRRRRALDNPGRGHNQGHGDSRAGGVRGAVVLDAGGCVLEQGRLGCAAPPSSTACGCSCTPPSSPTH